jgi:hypothetical protein
MKQRDDEKGNIEKKNTKRQKQTDVTKNGHNMD